MCDAYCLYSDYEGNCFKPKDETCPEVQNEIDQIEFEKEKAEKDKDLNNKKG